MNKQGFAIIEIIIYLGLLAMLLTLAALSLNTIVAGYNQNQAVGQTLDDLLFLDGQISQAIVNHQKYTIEQTGEFIFWQIENGPKEPMMTAPPGSLTVKKLPSDFGAGRLLEITIMVDYLPLTIYHYLP